MFFNKRVPSWLREAYYYDSLGGIFYGIFFGMSIAFFPIILRKMGAVDFQVAAITSFPFVGALFAIFWAHHSSRRPKMAFVIRFKAIARCILLSRCLLTTLRFLCLLSCCIGYLSSAPVLLTPG